MQAKVSDPSRPGQSQIPMCSNLVSRPRVLSDGMRRAYSLPGYFLFPFTSFTLVFYKRLVFLLSLEHSHIVQGSLSSSNIPLSLTFRFSYALLMTHFSLYSCIRCRIQRVSIPQKQTSFNRLNNSNIPFNEFLSTCFERIPHRTHAHQPYKIS
ncbi:uncharacterized protein BJ212DRAFT_714761 [Suillus subaureus]|uniref:Uncharacterized protein n=1 Tax=Suillus subaureus TaxID=48587 RepID=A0A9P7E0Y8_9AGAM|nr:uncharacterized protein BJ212DRAFT_714761 [Suillus subaureus]KAG1807971.1 hypothetical protein BJ212DRAFT_714761 [Suillus subaureus]